MQVDTAEVVETIMHKLTRILDEYRRPALAFSGGKDSTLIAHVVRANRLPIPMGWLDSPGLEYPMHDRWIRSFWPEVEVVATRYTPEWLSKNPQYLFPHGKIKQKFQALMPRDAVHRWATANRFDCVVWGRRDQENFCHGGDGYDHRAGYRVECPIRTLKTQDVLRVQEEMGWPVSPMYAMHGRSSKWMFDKAGSFGLDDPWKVVFLTDPTLAAMAERWFPDSSKSARDWLAERQRNPAITAGPAGTIQTVEGSTHSAQR